MEFWCSSSRGGAIAHQIRSKFQKFEVIPGGTLRKITATLCQMVDENEHRWSQLASIHPNIAYVIGGIPDVTERLQRIERRGERYEEVVFNRGVDACVQAVSWEYEYCEHLLKQKNLIPVFATIATMDLAIWNKHRMTPPRDPRKRRATDYLIYESQYPDMQYNLNNAIMQINDNIRLMNQNNNVDDLDLANYILIPREGNDQNNINNTNRYKIRTGKAKLRDGCHASPATAKKWLDHARAVYSSNRYKVSSPLALQCIKNQGPDYDLMGVPMEYSTLNMDI